MWRQIVAPCLGDRRSKGVLPTVQQVPDSTSSSKNSKVSPPSIEVPNGDAPHPCNRTSEHHLRAIYSANGRVPTDRGKQRATSEEPAKTLANGFFNPETVQEEAATLRASYLHEKMTKDPDRIDADELHEAIAKFKYLKENQRSECVSLIRDLPESTLRTEALDWLEFKWEYLSPQDRQKLTPSPGINIAPEELQKRIGEIYAEIRKLDEETVPDAEKNLLFLAKHIRLLSEWERQIVSTYVLFLPDKILGEKIAKRLFLQPEHMDFNLRNLSQLLPGQQTLAAQMPSKPCSLNIFSEAQKLALKAWANGASGQHNISSVRFI